jgi:CHASE1-domain containing sensor protein
VAPLRGKFSWIVISLCVALAYVVTAKLGLLLAVPPGYATAVWPPSGIALGALLVYGPRHWAGVWFGSFVTNMGTSFDPDGVVSIQRSLSIAAVIGLGAALQALLGAQLVRRFAGFPGSLTNERDIFRFFLLGGPVACGLAASVGVGTLYLAGAIPPAAVAYSWWTWWVGDTIGALIFSLLTVMWLGDDPHWNSRRVTVSAPLVVTFAAAILVFVYASRSETHKLKQRFEEDAGRLANDLAQRMALDIEKLAAVQALFAASDEVDAREFARFTEVALSGHSEILALSWVPLIGHDARGEFERELKLRGHAPLGIFERDGTRLRPRGAQSGYAPVQFIEPRRGYRPGFGYDLLSDPLRREVLGRARDSGLFGASGPITTLTSRQPLDAFFLVRAIYRPELPERPSLEQRRKLALGFATCAFRTREFIDVSLRGARGHERIRLSIDDVGPDGRVQRAYRSLQRSESRLGFDYRRTLAVGDHQWRLTFEPTLAYLVNEKSLLAWFVLAGGLIVCALVGAGALVLTGRTAAVERVVGERTAQLAKTNAELEREVERHVHTAQVLDQERSYLKAVLENLSEGIMVIDSHGETTLTNQAARNMQRLLVAPGARDYSPENFGLRHGTARPRSCGTSSPPRAPCAVSRCATSR